MAAVTDSTRNAVWQEMLDAARLARYYDSMSSRQQRWNRGVRLVLLASATAGIAAGMNALPESFRVVSGAVIGILVAWDFLADHANKAAVLGSIRRECNEAEVELAALWGEIQADSVEDNDARRMLADLARRVTRATDRAGSAHIPTNDRLNVRCEEAAFKALADRYAEG
ncbi:MAG: hypothetical protein OXF93_15500 [Acidobacteria bacterium]|nr:hypothetical protein [Acidobacteriota bacterium]